MMKLGFSLFLFVLVCCVFGDSDMVKSAHAVCDWACPEIKMDGPQCRATCLANYIFFVVHDGIPQEGLAMKTPYFFRADIEKVRKWERGVEGMCDVLCESMPHKEKQQCRIECFTAFLNDEK